MAQKTNNISNTLNYRLSVQISLNGLSFLVSNQDTQKTILFAEKNFDYSITPEELLIEVENIISENNIFNFSFNDISIVYATPVYTLVPLALFDETKASEYLKFNSKILANDYMAHDVLETHDIVVVYVPFMNINNYFFEKFGTFNYYHATTVMLKTILSHEKYALPKMFLHIQNNNFDSVILKDGKLELCNSYSYKTPEDFIYYTLFAIEQLNLNPDTLPVHLFGEVEEDDSIYKIAYNYIRHIEILDSSKYNLPTIENTISHKHFILKNTI